MQNLFFCKADWEIASVVWISTQDILGSTYENLEFLAAVENSVSCEQFFHCNLNVVWLDNFQ